MLEHDFSVYLEEVCDALGVRPPDDDIEKLGRYADELGRWNQRINLMRYRDRRELVVRHLSDGLAVIPHIPRDANRIIDVGAGGGIPGVVIAILRADLEVLAVEPIHKKHAFLKTVRRTVPVPNLEPVAMRLEDPTLAEDYLGRGFDVAVSRATFPIADWLAAGRRLVSTEGLVIALEGKERAELPEGAARFPYEAEQGRTRAVIVLAPATATPAEHD